jgi:hypothetical protein
MASSLLEEAATVSEATGASLAPYVALAQVTFQGREAEATQLIEAVTGEVVRRGEGLDLIHWVTAVLHNGLGRYEEALAAAQQAAEDTREVRIAMVELELIEAAARSGEADLAAAALARLSEITAARSASPLRAAASISSNSTNATRTSRVSSGACCAAASASS